MNLPHGERTDRYHIIMDGETLHDRLSSVAAGSTYRSLASLTNTHPETVRRYMQGQSPSVEFLGALCEAMSINADWLLTGRGPQRADQVRMHALRNANPTELHAAMASTMSSLVERVDRLESYCQTLETRVRGSASSGGREDARGSGPLSSRQDDHSEAPEIVTRARRVARSVTGSRSDDSSERPSGHAD